MLLGQADTGQVRISGTVVDPAGNPVAQAEVSVVATGVATFTSATGRFLLRVPRARNLVIQVRRPGYRGQLIRFTEDWDGKVLLMPGPVQLPDVKVAAKYAKPARYAGTAKYDDYFFRWRKGFGIFLDRDAIDRRGALTTAQLLEGQAGVHVDLRRPGDPTIIWFSRCNEMPPMIDVYVDGRRLWAEQSSVTGKESVLNGTRPGSGDNTAAVLARNAKLGEILERIPPSDIEFMEIFRGPGELPGEFNNGNCGAISIWTRQGRD
jgi:hypothetical protein